MKKIALFGGSFDPPHSGHIAVIESALRQLDIEKLIVVPAYLNPFKSGSHAPAVLRLEWLRKTFQNRDDVEISDFEVTKERPVKSIETVRHYLKRANSIYFIIGADNLESLEKWHQFEQLDKLVTWVVATREGIEIPKKYLCIDVTKPVSSTQLREKIEKQELPPEVAHEIADFYGQNDVVTPS